MAGWVLPLPPLHDGPSGDVPPLRHLLPYCLGGRFSIKPDHDLPSALLPNSWELQWVQNQGQVAKLLVSPRPGTNGPSFMKPLRSRSGHMQLPFTLFFPSSC